MIDMTSEEIARMLADAMIGRLCMADTDGTPYSIPLPFCWADDALYVRLALTGRKGEVLKQNDRVCFEVDSFSETFDEYASVIVEGTLIEVTDLAEKARIKALNDDKYLRLRRGHRPGHGRASALQTLPVRKIAVETIAGRKKCSAAASDAQQSPASSLTAQLQVA